MKAKLLTATKKSFSSRSCLRHAVIALLTLSGTSFSLAQASGNETSSGFVKAERVHATGFEDFKMGAVLQNYAPKHYRLQLQGTSNQPRDSVERAFYSEIARVCRGTKSKFESNAWSETVQGSGGATFTYHRFIGLFECES
jgi:hypothetical protein